MNNLTQTQTDAKQAHLNQQTEQMLKMYNVAHSNERKAVASHINGFLSIVSEAEKIFWLKFLNKLEQIDDKPKVLFPLGEIYLTIGGQEALEESSQQASEFLSLHQSGDWGLVCEDDKQENVLSVREGFRILSAYKTSQGVKIWVISEACRSSTTILLPEEY